MTQVKVRRSTIELKAFIFCGFSCLWAKPCRSTIELKEGNMWWGGRMKNMSSSIYYRIESNNPSKSSMAYTHLSRSTIELKGVWKNWLVLFLILSIYYRIERECPGVEVVLQLINLCRSTIELKELTLALTSASYHLSIYYRIESSTPFISLR